MRTILFLVALFGLLAAAPQAVDTQWRTTIRDALFIPDPLRIRTENIQSL